jgi:hypothetical protein
MKDIVTRNYRTPYGELILGTYEHRRCRCDGRHRRMHTTLHNRLRAKEKLLALEQDMFATSAA